VARADDLAGQTFQAIELSQYLLRRSLHFVEVDIGVDGNDLENGILAALCLSRFQRIGAEKRAAIFFVPRVAEIIEASAIAAPTYLSGATAVAFVVQ
jgi:hypothetical protein